MAWVAVDKGGYEWIYDTKPKRVGKIWNNKYENVALPKGSIEKLIGKKLTWEDEPVELKEEN